MNEIDVLLCIVAVLFMLIVLLSATTLHLYLTRHEKGQERQKLARNLGGGAAEYSDWARLPHNNPRR